MQPSTDRIRDLYEDKFATLLQGTWFEWRHNYIDQIRTVVPPGAADRLQHAGVVRRRRRAGPGLRDGIELFKAAERLGYGSGWT